jgi:HAD superfamily hydrolase (TIGR01509 family)
MLNLETTCHWVFDLDGTLTKPVHDFADIRRQLGIPPQADILGYLASLPPAAAQPLIDRLHAIEMELLSRTEAAPGAVPFVRSLAARGARLGILTRNSRVIARQTLAVIGLADCFPPEQIIGRDEAPPKPSPDGLQQLATRWGVPVSRLVMVGDYLYDLQTGRAAGAATIHVDPSGAFRWPHLADRCVATLQELVAEVSAVVQESP